MTEWAPDRGVTASPFPPIAEYGFLSDCETCALVAPNGNVEWLCLPRFDSPSVFGAILDRDAGGFRLGPADVDVPAARRYLPGTNVLETSWGTSGGWIIVRDVLLIGPWHHEHERSRTHTRAPTDYDADHVLLRLIRCVNGELQVTMDCDPRFDYARKLGEWEYSGSGYHEAVCRAEGSDVELQLDLGHEHGLRGPASHRPHADEGGRHAVRGAVLVRAPGSDDLRGRIRQARLDRAPLAALARPRQLPRPPVAHAPPARRAHAQGALVRAHRRARGGRDHLAAGDPGRRAQLGLPLQLDPRLDVHALGPLHARLRLGGERLLLLHRGHRGAGGRRPPDHVPDRRRGRDPRVHARPPVRLRGRAAGARRQRRLQAGAARRLGRAARLDLPAHEVAQLPAGPDLADREGAGGAGAREVARAGPRDLGDPRRAEALHLVEVDVLGGGGPRRAARRDPRRARIRGALAVGRRRDQGRHPRERRRRARGVHPALRHGRARRLGAPDRAQPLPAGRRRARGADRPRDRRRADGGRDGPPLPHGRDRRRPRGRGGQLRDLLVLARLRAGRDRRDPAARATCATSCSRTPARSASTRRRSTRARAATSATSRRRSRTWR